MANLPQIKNKTMKVHKMTAYQALSFAEYVQRNFEEMMNRFIYIDEPERGNFSEDDLFQLWLKDDSFTNE